MKTKLFFLLFISFVSNANAQLIVNGGSVIIQSNAAISVQGSVTTNADITGAGKIILVGNSTSINTNGFSIANLDINTTGSISLSGNTRVLNNINFTAGKILVNNFNLNVAPLTSITGFGSSKFIETNGTGQLRKEVTAAGNYTLPLGVGSLYMPLDYVVSGGSYASGAYLSGMLLNATHPNKPLRAEDYLNQYWRSNYNGITGATINATTNYLEVGGLTGLEVGLNGLVWDGSNWGNALNTINTATNAITYPNVINNTDLYAMNKFVLAKAKVFLQGAYNSSTGLMSDNLRNAPSLIPLSDPYRVAPYSTNFAHFNNATIETIASSVLNTQANSNDNIVDWVFLELRNTTNQLIQTRSALLQRDGDIVDTDGINAVCFKDINPANYILTVRHRNHLGMGAEQTTYSKSLGLNNPALSNSFDFSSATDAEVFGPSTAFTIASHPTLTSVNLLWGGNANSNSTVRFSGLQNDKDFILVTTLSNSPSLLLNNVYHQADINMNRNVRYAGLQNDKDFLLVTVLNSEASVVRTQAIPN